MRRRTPTQLQQADAELLPALDLDSETEALAALLTQLQQAADAELLAALDLDSEAALLTIFWRNFQN